MAMTDLYQVDAFADKLFEGNPAAVVLFDEWPADSLLQSIAAENNLAETAYLVACGKQWELRWFTPAFEVALCGHATLAAAHVLYNHLGCQDKTITFVTRFSGNLIVERKEDDSLAMVFPAIVIRQYDKAEEVAVALGHMPSSVWAGNYSTDQFDIVAVFDSADEVAALQPNDSLFEKLGSRGVIATAAAQDFDFVSRYFAPAFGIPEDPVTGSAHCLLTPYWAGRLKKTALRARQISPRSGTLNCRLLRDKVELTGRAVDYMKGSLSL